MNIFLKFVSGCLLIENVQRLCKHEEEQSFTTTRVRVTKVEVVIDNLAIEQKAKANRKMTKKAVQKGD